MKTVQKEGYTLITVAETPILASLKKYQALKKEHLVIRFVNQSITTQEIASLLPIAEEYKKNKRSFVVISNVVIIDELPENLTVVPTLVEAEDIIAMENLERHLNL